MQKQSNPPPFVTLCGRIFRDADPAYFPRAQYRGRTLFFCTESCLGAFLADPQVFYKAHRNAKPADVREHPLRKEDYMHCAFSNAPIHST